MIDEIRPQSKLVNHWKVRKFPNGDNCRQIRKQDTQGGQWWLSQVLREEYKRDKIIRGKEHVKKTNNNTEKWKIVT